MSIYDPLSRRISVVKGESINNGFQLYSAKDGSVFTDADLSEVRLVSSALGIDVACQYDSQSEMWYPEIGGDVTGDWDVGNYTYDLKVVYASAGESVVYSAIHAAELDVLENVNEVSL